VVVEASPGSLVGVDLLLLGYLDGKGVRIEGDLRSIKLPFGIANALRIDRQPRHHRRNIHVGATQPEVLLTLDLGVVREVDDGSCSRLLNLNGDQVSVA